MVPSLYYHIVQFAHREGIRYSMSGRSPDSRMPCGRRTSSHAAGGRSDFKFRLDSLTVAGAVPELSANLSARTGFPFHSPTHRWTEAPDNGFSVIHNRADDNSCSATMGRWRRNRGPTPEGSSITG